MAGSLTHLYFTKDIYNKLNKDQKELLKNHQDLLNIYGQGFDVLFFDFLNKNRKLSNYFHNNNTKDFFINTIKYIKDNKLEQNPEAISFLYGFICHYSLDTIVHPYIIFRSGYFYKKRKKETLKYNGVHDEYETYIDSYFVNERENKNINEIDISKFLNYKNYESNNELINYVFLNTFNKKNYSKVFNRSIKNMKFLYKILRNDKKGNKKKIYKLIDKITPKSSKRLVNVSYNVKLNKNIYYLNLDKRKWSHPLDKNETYNLSFLELYENAIKNAMKLINASNKVLYKNENISYLDKYFTNLSYSTGKDCSIKKEFKYFNF